MLLRANSLRPCNIEELEDQDLFFDLWDDMPSSELTETYCPWPLNPKLNGYVCILPPYSDGTIRWNFSVVLDRETDRVPPLFVAIAEFSHDEREKTFVQGDSGLDGDIEKMLGIEWSK